MRSPRGQALAHDMLETMVAVGSDLRRTRWASPNASSSSISTPSRRGRGRRVRDPALGPHVMINPQIVAREGIVWEEGCLSVEEVGGVGAQPFFELILPTSRGNCDPRSERADGGLHQHEIDHLDGIVYPDRMHDRRARAIRRH